MSKRNGVEPTRAELWFAWRRSEATAQLACSRAYTAEADVETYAVLSEIYDRLSWPQRVWLEVYEWRRSYVRIRNRRGKVFGTSSTTTRTDHV